MELDDEARALAWARAQRRQGREVVRAGFRPEEWATPADPTAILDGPDAEAAEGAWQPLMLVIDFGPLGDALVLFAHPFVVLGEQITKALTPLAKAFDQLAVAASDEPTATEPPKGFSCPRHGWQSTRWGCRACQRQHGLGFGRQAWR